MKKLPLLFLAAVMTAVLFAGCGTASDSGADASADATAENPSVTGNFRTESYISGVLYQESAEVAAQQIQAFELATLKLKEKVAKVDKNDNGKIDGDEQKLAIVSDIDATLMDDSTYIAGAILRTDQEPWNNGDWNGYYGAIASDKDTAIPGALEFVKAAREMGVEVYYITNRPYYELDITVQQMKNAGFPVDSKGYEKAGDYVEILEGDELTAYAEKINKGDSGLKIDAGYFTNPENPIFQVQGTDYSSDKQARRKNVQDIYGEENVVMYLGDSINDFLSDSDTEDFSRTIGNADRTENVTSKNYVDKWGAEYIVLPNSAYGDWLKATWYKDKAENAAQETEWIKKQLEENSYLNGKTWYKGNSPIGPDVQ